MKWFAIGLFALGLLLTAASTRPNAKAGAAASSEVQRGAYLVRVAGCEDCHTPKHFDPRLGAPVPDMQRQLSGHPASGPEPEGTVGQHDIGLIGPSFTGFKLPFGTVYSANLTPDPDTGIGLWTADQFIASMRTGKHMGSGRAVLPPMPWEDFSGMTDADLRAIFAYLRSLPPVKNAVPAPKVPPPVLQQMAKTNAELVKRIRGGKG